MAQTLPTIAGVEITTDSAGRFNLNALHKASGLGDHKAPNQWLRNAPAQELINAWVSQTAPTQSANENTPVSVVNGGLNSGTFAVEEIAISYAGWIKPEFQLAVNRVFIAYRTGRLEPLVAPAPTPAVDLVSLSSSLIELVGGKVLSNRAAMRRFDAAMLSANPGMATFMARPPRQPRPVAVPSPQRELLPAATPTPTKAPTPKQPPKPANLVMMSGATFDIRPEYAFPFNEVAERVVGGVSTLKRALIARGLMDEYGNPTKKAAALTRKGPFAGVKNWLVLDTLRAVGALR